MDGALVYATYLPKKYKVLYKYVTQFITFTTCSNEDHAHNGVSMQPLLEVYTLIKDTYTLIHTHIEQLRSLTVNCLAKMVAWGSYFIHFGKKQAAKCHTFFCGTVHMASISYQGQASMYLVSRVSVLLYYIRRQAV